MGSGERNLPKAKARRAERAGASESLAGPSLQCAAPKRISAFAISDFSIFPIGLTERTLALGRRQVQAPNPSRAPSAGALSLDDGRTFRTVRPAHEVAAR